MKKEKNQTICSTDLKEGPVESQLVLPSSPDVCHQTNLMMQQLG